MSRAVVKVSVVIPVHNCEPYIAAAVESVLRQERDDVELIVVDDGSSDGTLDQLKPFQEQVQIIRQVHRGVAAARNKGLAAARGDFVAFLDADDWWFRSRLSAQFTALQSFPDAGLLFSDFCVADAEAVPILTSGIRWKYGLMRDAAAMPWDRIFSAVRTIHWTDPSNGPMQAKAYCGNISRWLFLGNIINTSSVLVRRDALLQVGGFDDTLGTEEDYDCWLRVAHEWSMVYVDAPLVAFRRRDGQLTAPDQIERVLRNVAVVVDRAADRMSDILDARARKARLSKVHRDIGVMCLRTGRNQEARRHLWQSLNQWPPHALSFALLPLSVLPAGLFGKLEQYLRVFKRRSRRAAS